MLRRWFLQKGSLLGLDISSSHLSVACVRRRGRSWVCADWAVEELPQSVALRADQGDRELSTIATALHTAWLRCGGATRRVAVAVPGRLLTVSFCSVPAGLDARELEVRALLEVDRCIPYAAEEAALDYRVLGPCPDDAQQLRLLLAICPAWYPRALERCAARAGLQLAAVDGEPWAVARCCREHIPTEGRALLVVERDGLLSCALFDAAVLQSCQEMPLPPPGAVDRDTPLADATYAPAAAALSAGKDFLSAMGCGTLARVLFLGSPVEQTRAFLEESCAAPVTAVPIPVLAPSGGAAATSAWPLTPSGASSLGVACGLALREL